MKYYGFLDNGMKNDDKGILWYDDDWKIKYIGTFINDIKSSKGQIIKESENDHILKES
jgi:hypothetical protein